MNQFKYSAAALAAWAAFGATVWWVTSLIFPYPVNGLLAFAVWIVGVSSTLKWFIASVPAQTALVLSNQLNGSHREVSSGLSFKLPWESMPMENFLELRTLQGRIQGRFIAKDGPVVIVDGAVHFRIKPGRAVVAISHTESAFFEGIRQICTSFLNDYLSQNDARTTSSNAKVLEEKLLVHLNSQPQSLADRFGVEVELVSISDISFESDFQNVRTKNSMAAELVEIARRLRVGDMTEREALEAAMTLSGDISKRVVQVSTHGAGSLSASLVAIAETLRNPK